MITERTINQISQTSCTATHDDPWSFLLNLFHSLDLIIICLLNSFVMKGAWFPLIILAFSGACLLVILRKVSLKLSYAASLSLIFKHLLKGASVISFRKSASLNCL